MGRKGVTKRWYKTSGGIKKKVRNRNQDFTSKVKINIAIYSQRLV